jgi:hypothetical protein
MPLPPAAGCPYPTLPAVLLCRRLVVRSSRAQAWKINDKTPIDLNSPKHFLKTFEFEETLTGGSQKKKTESLVINKSNSCMLHCEEHEHIRRDFYYAGDKFDAAGSRGMKKSIIHCSLSFLAQIRLGH